MLPRGISDAVCQGLTKGTSASRKRQIDDVDLGDNRECSWNSRFNRMYLSCDTRPNCCLLRFALPDTNHALAFGWNAINLRRYDDSRYGT